MNLTTKSGYTVEPVTTETGLLHLADDWNRLSETSRDRNVFMTFDWFRSWDKRLTQDEGGDRRPNVLALKKDRARLRESCR